MESKSTVVVVVAAAAAAAVVVAKCIKLTQCCVLHKNCTGHSQSRAVAIAFS